MNNIDIGNCEFPNCFDISQNIRNRLLQPGFLTSISGDPIAEEVQSWAAERSLFRNPDTEWYDAQIDQGSYEFEIAVDVIGLAILDVDGAENLPVVREYLKGLNPGGPGERQGPKKLTGTSINIKLRTREEAVADKPEIFFATDKTYNDVKFTRFTFPLPPLNGSLAGRNFIKALILSDDNGAFCSIYRKNTVDGDESITGIKVYYTKYENNQPSQLLVLGNQDFGFVFDSFIIRANQSTQELTTLSELNKKECYCNDSNDCLFDENAACARGCRKCGGGGNFMYPRKYDFCNCETFTNKTKFACGYKCGWKGPCFWDFAACGLQWGNHVGGDGSRSGYSQAGGITNRNCNLSCNNSNCDSCANCNDCNTCSTQIEDTSCNSISDS